MQTLLLQAGALSAGVENNSSIPAASFSRCLFKMLLLMGGGNGLERQQLAKATTCQRLQWWCSRVVMRSCPLAPSHSPVPRFPWCPAQEMCLRLQEGPDSHVCHETQQNTGQREALCIVLSGFPCLVLCPFPFSSQLDHFSWSCGHFSSLVWLPVVMRLSSKSWDSGAEREKSSLVHA